ncbi:MAG TPA: hypothetical protein VM490_25935 [Armatimonadaceae bacterium]|nr:hypothetical protein [Armatimonadaceae bacterium]
MKDIPVPLRPVETPRRAFLRRGLLLGVAAGSAGAVLPLLVGGCGGGGGSTPFPTPTPTPSPSPGGAGDFAFAGVSAPGSASYAIGNSEGVGTLPLAVRSASGFSAPITFSVASITARNVLNDAAIEPSAVTAAVTPASLPTLPVGDTPITLEARGLGSLPPVTRVSVNVRAEGGGLSRSSGYRFYVPGVALPTGFTVTLRPTTDAYPLLFSVAAAGVAGRLEVRFDGLPAGFSAGPASVDVTGVPEGAGDPLSSVTLTLQRGGVVAPGVYPVRLVATLNGAVVRNELVSLTVQEQAAPPIPPQLTVETEDDLRVTRGGPALRTPARLTITQRNLTLNLRAKTLPPGVSVAFDDPTIALVVGQPRDTALTIAATGAAATGPQRLELEATSGELIYPIRLTLTVT